MLLPGMKVTILLEEIAALDASFDYDAFYVDIMKLDQFSSGFVAANPNSKIPTLMDYSFEPPLRVDSFSRDSNSYSRSPSLFVHYLSEK